MPNLKKTGEGEMEILNKIQMALKVPKAQKNTFGNYNYRSCEDILEAVKPLLGKASLILTDEIVMIGDRFYVKATATLSDEANTVSVSAFARESVDKKGMDVAQITGAASSYARKYALNGLFCVDDTKDADALENNNAPVEFIDEKQKSAILDSLTTLETTTRPMKAVEAGFCKMMGVTAIEEIKKSDYDKALKAIGAAQPKPEAKK
jgi:hypothetical protein